MSLTVLDLFCGAGGFSHGFLQEGFNIVLGIDNNLAVQDTFLANHPGAEFLHSDMKKVNSELLSGFSPVDVLIGSPPCIDFSLMSTSSRDPEKGLELVREFFRIKNILQPKYSIMENVVPAIKFIRSLIPFVRAEILDAVDFGVPQFRRRVFFGNHPAPTPTHHQIEGQLTLAGTKLSQWSVLGDIIDSSVNFCFIGAERDRKLAALKQSRTSKNDIVCGNVIYPDPLDKPSRTLLAKISKANRSTIVIELNGRRRLLGIKEKARLQGFLDSFLWFGTPSKIEIMIGNAVPPPVSRAIAKAILRKEREA